LARHAHPDQIQSSFVAWRVTSRLRVAGHHPRVRTGSPQSRLPVGAHESVLVTSPESGVRVVNPESMLRVATDEHRSLIDDEGLAAVGRLQCVVKRLPMWLRWRGRARASARATTP
jgi:hypothetical protein